MWTGNEVELLLNIIQEYKVYTFIRTHVSWPTRNYQTSIILVMSAVA